MHSIMQHTLSMFLHNIKHVPNQERDIIIHLIHPKKNKTRHKIKYFCHFKTNKTKKNQQSKHALKQKTTKP